MQDIGTIAVCLGTVAVLWAFFQFTKVGLALRAAAVNPAEARLVGVRVPLMLGLGWGLAAVLGAIAGMLTAPSVFLDPNMMQAVLIYAFAAAVLGGIDSPVGAVVGGLDARRRPQPARQRTSTSSAPTSSFPRRSSSSSSSCSFARPVSSGSRR